MSQKLSPICKSESKQPEEERYWQEYYPKLKQYCHFLSQNNWDGDDISQETYLKALKYTNQTQKMTSALLNKIAYHHWIDLLRKRSKETLIEDVDETRQSFERSNGRIERVVDSLLEQFTPKQAVIFLLKEGFHYQLKEIAELLNTTEAAVKSNLHRAKRRLEKEETESARPFWIEEEREKLANLFSKALECEDPAALIEAIPTLTSMVADSAPKLILKTYSPSSTLCMAA